MSPEELENVTNVMQFIIDGGLPVFLLFAWLWERKAHLETQVRYQNDLREWAGFKSNQARPSEQA